MNESSYSALFLGFLSLFALGALLMLMQSILLPFVLAVFLSLLFKPVILYFRRKKIPTFAALLFILLVLSAVGFGLSMIISSSVQAFIEQLPKYQGKLEAMFAGLNHIVRERAAWLGVDPAKLRLDEAVSLGSLTGLVSSGLGSLLSFLSNAFLILLFMLFILAGSGQFAERIEAALPPGNAERISNMIANIDAKVRRYLVTKTLVSLATGTCTTLVLLIFGVDFALLWGFVAFLFNFIPNVGSMVAVIFPMVVSLVQFDSLTQTFFVVVLLVVIQNLIGNVLEPKLFEYSLNLSPLLVLVSLIFWGWLWGIWGMILAVPITSVIKIIFENVDSLRPVAVLMSGKSKK